MADPELILEWEGPFVMKDIEALNYPGFYCISSYRNGKPSKLLYIGQSTTGSIRKRLSDHEEKWFSEYRGIRIHYAILSRKDVTMLGRNGILCVENAMIFAYDPERNQVSKYSVRNDIHYNSFIVKNKGALPMKFDKVLDMRKVAEDCYRGTKKKKVTKKKKDDNYPRWFF